MVKYIINLIKSLKELLLVYLFQFIWLFILFLLKVDYNLLYLGIIGFNIIIICYLLRKKNISFMVKDNYYPLASLGIGISLFFNMLIMLVFSNEVNNSINLFLVILSTGIVGPILEEMLFRKCLIDNLLKFNGKYKAIIVSSIIFSLVHSGIFTILYTFILGIVLGYIYLKYQDIKASMIVHIMANLIVIFVYDFNVYILLFSFIVLMLSILMIRKDKTLHLN